MNDDARRDERTVVLRIRHRFVHLVRAFFDAREFIEVETPALVPSPGIELHVDALGVEGAGERRWLIPSPELHMKRLLGPELPCIYQLARCFRRGELGGLHQPEFTMLEWYRADAGSADVMKDTEELVADVVDRLTGGRGTLRRGDIEVDVTQPWEQLTVARAFERYASVPLAQVVDDDDAFYRTLVDEVEPKLGHKRPTFLTHYPARMASLARLHPDDPTTADRFEAYVAGVEICNGFGELVDAAEQRRRFVAEREARARVGKVPYPIDERFLAALERGLPPSGGNALGLDRLLMLVLGADRVDEVIAFPDGEA